MIAQPGFDHATLCRQHRRCQPIQTGPPSSIRRMRSQQPLRLQAPSRQQMVPMLPLAPYLKARLLQSMALQPLVSPTTAVQVHHRNMHSQILLKSRPALAEIRLQSMAPVAVQLSDHCMPPDCKGWSGTKARKPCLRRPAHVSSQAGVMRVQLDRLLQHIHHVCSCRLLL